MDKATRLTLGEFEIFVVEQNNKARIVVEDPKTIQLVSCAHRLFMLMEAALKDTPAENRPSWMEEGKGIIEEIRKAK